MQKISDRIKEGLELRKMKQADLVNLTGISKGALSSYISGSYEPKQKNIYKIAKALNVNEAWLMGYNVPMEILGGTYTVKEVPQPNGYIINNDQNLDNNHTIKISNSYPLDSYVMTPFMLSEKEKEHIEDLRKLNDTGIEKAINYTKDLTEMPKYQKNNNVTTLPKKEIWEEEGKEHLMPIASHDDGLTEEQKNIMNEKIAEFLKTLK